MEGSQCYKIFLFSSLLVTSTVMGIGIRHTVCIGCNDLLQVGNTSYYCRGTNKILLFRCDLTEGISISWIFNDDVIENIANLDSGNTFQTKRGFISIYTQTVDTNEDGSRTNITSYLWFNTADIPEETTVTCSGAGSSDSVNVKPLGDPVPFNQPNVTFSPLKNSPSDVYVLYEWDYNNTLEVAFFDTEIRRNGTSIHHQMVFSSMRNSSGIIQESSMPSQNDSVRITAVGYCGINRSNSTDRKLLDEVTPETLEDDSDINVAAIVVGVIEGAIILVLIFVIVVQCFINYKDKKQLRDRKSNITSEDE